MITKIRSWLSALRLRTLPLALSLMIVGATLALQFEVFSLKIFISSIITATFLQILSNFANDYGDAVSGVDENRVGEKRAVSSGMITKKAMLRAIILMIILSLISGLILLIEAYEGLKLVGFATLFAVGILSILAAIFYTMGKRPYGYIGLGDLMVFVFFGIVGVEGSFTLYNGEPTVPVLLPASAIGLFSVGVINLNNIRDFRSDKASGKRTIIVRFGEKFGKYYQISLLTIGMILMIIYIVSFGKFAHFLSLIALPLFIKNIFTIAKTTENIDGQLKIVSLGTLILSIGFFIGELI